MRGQGDLVGLSLMGCGEIHSGGGREGGGGVGGSLVVPSIPSASFPCSWKYGVFRWASSICRKKGAIKRGAVERDFLPR